MRWWNVKCLRLILLMGCVCLLLPARVVRGDSSDWSQDAQNVPSTFQITFAELEYEEKVLNSPYGATEYTLRLPAGWELREGSFVELDFSYAYDRVDQSGSEALPSLFGDIIVVIDGQTQQVSPITAAALDHSHLRLDLPLDLLNNPLLRTHSIKVALDTSSILSIPHQARLTVHPTSFFSLVYSPFPITVDLASFPRPFYQRAFEPDKVRFVLPVQPAEVELTGAMAIAARFGDLVYPVVIGGTSDLELLDRLEALGAEQTLHEHLIVVGKPETNMMIMTLNQLGALPLPLRERQMVLNSAGPAMVSPGAILTYTLALTNTAQDVMSSLTLVDTLPAYTQLVACSPQCTQGEAEREILWPLPSMKAGETFRCTLTLRLSEVITDSVLDNAVHLLHAESGLLNADTLTTTVYASPLTEPGSRSSAPNKSRYLFVTGERAVPESDGVVQELVSPWDQTQAILVITGLSDEAIYKASRAISVESRFPGMKGPFALVREVYPLPELLSEPQTTDLTFADMGYDDRLLEGLSQQKVIYYFDIPFRWRLTKKAYLDLLFSHSQLLDYGSSYLNVSFNNKPIATVTLSDETSLDGELRVELPFSQARPGEPNLISVESVMYPADKYADVNTWLLINSASLLHLDHEEQTGRYVDLSVYPYPFSQRPDLADVMFVVPPEPRPDEWEEALQVGAALGQAAGGTNLAPIVVLGNTYTQTELADYHIIAIGRPSRNPALQAVNPQLPQPFQPGYDEIEQWIDRAAFRLPPGLSLGLVQLMTSPWNEERVFLAVTGTTDESVKWAADAVTNSPWILQGNLVLIREDQVSTIDTRELTRQGKLVAVSAVVPEMAPAATLPSSSAMPGSPASGKASAGSPHPTWLVPVVGVMGVVAIAVFVIAFWRTRRQAGR